MVNKRSEAETTNKSSKTKTKQNKSFIISRSIKRPHLFALCSENKEKPLFVLKTKELACVSIAIVPR